MDSKFLKFGIWFFGILGGILLFVSGVMIVTNLLLDNILLAKSVTILLSVIYYVVGGGVVSLGFSLFFYWRTKRIQDLICKLTSENHVLEKKLMLQMEKIHAVLDKLAKVFDEALHFEDWLKKEIVSMIKIQRIKDKGCNREAVMAQNLEKYLANRNQELSKLQHHLRTLHNEGLNINWINNTRNHINKLKSKNSTILNNVKTQDEYVKRLNTLLKNKIQALEAWFNICNGHEHKVSKFKISTRSERLRARFVMLMPDKAS